MRELLYDIYSTPLFNYTLTGTKLAAVVVFIYWAMVSRTELQRYYVTTVFYLSRPFLYVLVGLTAYRGYDTRNWVELVPAIILIILMTWFSVKNRTERDDWVQDLRLQFLRTVRERRADR